MQKALTRNGSMHSVSSLILECQRLLRVPVNLPLSDALCRSVVFSPPLPLVFVPPQLSHLGVSDGFGS